MGYSVDQIQVFQGLFEAVTVVNSANVAPGEMVIGGTDVSRRLSTEHSRLIPSIDDSACEKIVRQAYQDAQVVLGKAGGRLSDGVEGDAQVQAVKKALTAAQGIIPVYPPAYLAAYKAVNALFGVKRQSAEVSLSKEEGDQQQRLTDGLEKLQDIGNPMSARELTEMIGAFRLLATAVMKGANHELTEFNAVIDAMGPLNIAYKAQNPDLAADAGLEEAQEEAPEHDVEVVEASPQHSPEKIAAYQALYGAAKALFSGVQDNSSYSSSTGQEKVNSMRVVLERADKMVAKDASEFNVEEMASPELDTQINQLCGIVTVFSDVLTERGEALLQADIPLQQAAMGAVIAAQKLLPPDQPKVTITTLLCQALVEKAVELYELRHPVVGDAVEGSRATVESWRKISKMPAARALAEGMLQAANVTEFSAEEKAVQELKDILTLADSKSPKPKEEKTSSKTHPPLQNNLGTIIFLTAMLSTGLLFPIIAPAAMTAILSVISLTASALALPALIGISVGMFAVGGLLLTGLDRAFNLTNRIRIPGFSALRKPSITITLMSVGFVAALAVTLLVAPVMPVVMGALAGALAAVGLAGVVTISALPVFAIPLAVAGVAALGVGAVIGGVKLLGMMGKAIGRFIESKRGESKIKGGVGEPRVLDSEREPVVDPDAQPGSRRVSEIGKEAGQKNQGEEGLAGGAPLVDSVPPAVPFYPRVVDSSSSSRLRSGSLDELKTAETVVSQEKSDARKRANSAPLVVSAQASKLVIPRKDEVLALSAGSLQKPRSSSDLGSAKLDSRGKPPPARKFRGNASSKRSSPRPPSPPAARYTRVQGAEDGGGMTPSGGGSGGK